MPYNSLISRSDAQALVPEQVSNAILGNLAAQSAALQSFRRVTMSTNTTRMPVLSALPVAYFVDGDTGLKQTTEAAWSDKNLNVEEIAAIVPIPENVFDDASFDVWGTIQPLLEGAIARTLDAAVFFGTNKPASWPDAIVTAATAAGHVVARGTNAANEGAIAADFSDAMALVEADGFDVNFAVANRSYRGLLRNLRDANGVLLQEVSPESAYGIDIQYPLRGMWPSGASAAEVILGDREEAIIGVRKDITYKLLDQAVIQDGAGAIVYNLAQQDMIAMRVTFRCAFQVANTISYDSPTLDANHYPFAVVTSPAV